MQQPKGLDQLQKDDEEGFLRDDRLVVKDIEESHCLQEVVIELPAGKELITVGRPLDMKARCLTAETICQLPEAVNNSTPEQQQVKPESTIRASSRMSARSTNNMQQTSIGVAISPPPQTVKRVYNGRGKTLYDFFEVPDSFQCVFRKSPENRPIPEQMYDYTANPKILELTNDYDPKLYCPLLPPSFQPSSFSPSTLSFCGSFQSGNLNRVFRSVTSPSQYFLLLDNDSNTHGYNHWFFFQVKGMKKQTYTFHVVNMTKKSSMYRQGMKVSVFSEVANRLYKRGWVKGGDEITYSNTRIERTTKENETYYALAWNYTSQEEEDTVYFALNHPYTYTRLVGFVEGIENVFRDNNISIVRKNIGYTMANNIIQSLVITDESVNKQKKVLLFMARQHPGETVGSFVAEGIIETLSISSPLTVFLLKNFRIVVIPMVNPDGVIYGHSRCNLAGLDLNRQWSVESVKELTPQTFAIRRYIVNLNQQYGIETMIDLHGHSKKMNSFFYACRRENKCAMRLLSYAMGKFQDNFDLFSCTYGLSKDKVNTARSQLFMMGINSYTLENSYYGRQKNNLKQHYSESDLKGIGSSLIKALFVLYADKQAMNNYKMNKQILMEEIEANLERFQTQENKNKNDSGSESDPDGDLLALEERVRTIKVRDQTKKTKLFRSMTGVLKKKKYVSTTLKKKIEEREAQAKSVSKQKKKSKEKQLRNVSIEPTFPSERPKKPSRTSLMLAKKFQRPARTLTETFKPSQKQLKQKPAHKFETPVRSRQTFARKQLSSKNNSIPSRILYQHPYRKKTNRQPLKLTRTEQTATHQAQTQDQSTKRVQSTHRRFMTELDAIKLKLNNQQLFKSCEFINKQQSLDETEFIKIESFYKNNRKQREIFFPSPKTLSRKVSRSKKKFKVAVVEQPTQTFTTKFRKFESFLSDLQTYSNSKYKGYSYGGLGGLGDSNSVFYHFPLL